MPGTTDRSERWAGGFIRTVGEGPARQRLYVIRRMVAGTRYEVSTKRSTEAEALVELVRFQQSPSTYEPLPEPDLLGDEGPEPLYLDADLVKEYLDRCTAAGISKTWWDSKRLFLAWWMEQLHGVDLRRADLKADILKPLAGATSRPHRIKVIKHFYAWLRDADGGKGILGPSEDPTLARLKVPQSSPAQRIRRRAFSPADLVRVKAALATGPRWRIDAIDVLSGTGWHYSELRRFAEAGEVEELPLSQRARSKKAKAEPGCATAVLVVVHKNGSTHKTAVGAEVLAAAQRLRAKGHLPPYHFFRVLRDVNRELKLKVPVTAGSFRHTVATEAIEQGATPEAVSAFLGHKSTATTKRFYATLAVPPKIPTLR